jgi:hypothetical protein
MVVFTCTQILWEHEGCWECVQQDANLRCGHWDCHHIGTCEICVRVACNIKTILTYGIRRYVVTLHCFCVVLNASVSIVVIKEGMCVH